MYFYLKALHIIFIVTWFAGLFYMPRLLIYATEAQAKTAVEKQILTPQFLLMQTRLWYGITWPSAILTLVLGTWVATEGNWWQMMRAGAAIWLWHKLGFVLLLYGYHFFLHRLFKEEQKGIYRLSSTQLRIWNEVATIFLFAIVFLVVVKTALSLLHALLGLALLVALLLGGIYFYKKRRLRNQANKP